MGNPLPGIDVYADDNNNLYETDGYTDANGKYVAVVLGGWAATIPGRLKVSSDNQSHQLSFFAAGV